MPVAARNRPREGAERVDAVDPVDGGAADAANPTDHGRPGIEVINRAVDILAAFARGAEMTLSLAEIARRTGLPKPTIHRLLAALDVVGLVVKTDHGYQLGIRLFELGEHVPRKQRLREAALPFMQDLYEASHDTVHLAVLDGLDVVYLERIRGHKVANIASRVGGRLPAHSTGVGKALLAHHPEVARRVMAAPMVPRTPYTITSPRLLAEELERIRAAGIAYDREENSIGIKCAAAPILVDGVAVGAVSITGPGLEVERYAPAVKAAALGIRRTLMGAAPARARP